MLHDKFRKSFFNIRSCVTIAFVLVLAGCAQTQGDDYYNPPAEGTLSDAQRHAMGKRGSRAPSQLQIGFGEQAKKPAPIVNVENTENNDNNVIAMANNRALAKPLLQPKTFLGTLPCADSSDCQANRVTITFAPSGEWRAKTQAIGSNTNDKPSYQQGCWNITGQNPLRIVIQSINNAINASFTFSNNNVLVLTNYNSSKPTLDYRLTRQAEIDPIAELNDVSKLNCD